MKVMASVVATRQEIVIHTSFVYPPIPSREMDWSAVDDNTYDASFEGSDESGDHWKQSAHGVGATEQEAIADLLEQLEEEAPCEHRYVRWIPSKGEFRCLNPWCDARLELPELLGPEADVAYDVAPREAA